MYLRLKVVVKTIASNLDLCSLRQKGFETKLMCIHVTDVWRYLSNREIRDNEFSQCLENGKQMYRHVKIFFL